MFSRRTFGLVSSGLAMLAVGLFYSNCSKDLPTDASNSSSSSAPMATLTPLLGSVSPASVNVNVPAQVTPAGGRPPYTYSVNGGASISPSGAVSSAASGNFIITIADSAGQSVQVGLSVTSPAPPPTPTVTCALPWGGSISVGQSVTAFNTTQLVCPTTAACRSEVRVCGSNGVLSGSFTAASCTKLACVYKEIAYNNDPGSASVVCGSASQTYGGVPASCSDSEYASSGYCLLGSTATGYGSHLLQCRGPNESITPIFIPNYGSGGGGGGGGN